MLIETIDSTKFTYQSKFVPNDGDAGNTSAANQHSLHTVGATTNGERGPNGVDARGSGKEATASDENYHSSRPSLSNSLSHKKSCRLYLSVSIERYDTYCCIRELFFASLYLTDNLMWVC